MNIKNGILLLMSAMFLWLSNPLVATTQASRLARHTKKRQQKNLITQSVQQPPLMLAENQLQPTTAPLDTIIQEELKNIENPVQDVVIKDVPATPSIPTPVKQLAEDQQLIGETTPELDLMGIETKKEIPEILIEDEETIEFNFENANLDQLVKQIEQIFNITFISSENLDPSGAKSSLKGNKISFKTNKPLSKKDAWGLFLSFLEMAGFMVVPGNGQVTLSKIEVPLIPPGQTALYKIIPLDKVVQAPLPTFIGIDSTLLPENDQVIRYIYFVQNNSTKALEPVAQALKSSIGNIIALQEHNAFLFTDKSYNIRQLMEILKELDQASMPQTMAVLKLKRANASDVKTLFENLVPSEEKGSGVPARLFPSKKSSMSLYFPENVKMIVEPMSNSLILLGPARGIKKIEDFITEYVDTDIKKPYAPIFTYQLNYANATTVANIMNDLVKFGEGTTTAGSVRAGDKYLQPMFFVPEEESNQLIIKGNYNDFLMAKEILKQLDEPQPQIALEVLVLSLDISDTRILGMQMRSKEPCGINGLVGNNVKYQTSGLFTGTGGTPQSIVQNTSGEGIMRLLGDLISLASGAPAGNTLVALGDQLGVWGIAQALETISTTQVLSNPFLLVSNKTKAKVNVGEIRRIVKSIVVPISGNQVPTFGDESATVSLDITPQINSDGMIVLTLDVNLSVFIGPSDPTQVQKTTREVNTRVIVANKEVIAIGGLIQNTTANNTSKVPILGDIPIIGWLFKNKQQQESKNSLIILISSTIVEPEPISGMNNFTRKHVNYYEANVSKIHNFDQPQDPINRWFFKESEYGTDFLVDNFLFKNANDPQGVLPTEITAKNNRNKKRKRSKKPNGPDPITPTLPQPVAPAAPSGTVWAQNQLAPNTSKSGESKRSILDFFDKSKGATT